MEEVVPLILTDQLNQGGEKVLVLCHDLSGVKDIFLEDKPDDLYDIDSSCSQLWPFPPAHLQLINTFVHEVLQKGLEILNYLRVLGQNEGHIGQVGKENRGVVYADMLVSAHYILDNLGDHLEREKGLLKLRHLVASLEVRSDLFNYLTDVGGKVAHDVDL